MGASLGVLICLLGGGAAVADPQVAAEVSRLEGQRVTISPSGKSYTIDDIAGEGAPLVGVVRRRGGHLWLVTKTARYRLAGPLARPRIAGPDYKVWILGAVAGEMLTIRRIGILAPPGRFDLRSPRRGAGPITAPAARTPR